MPRYVRSRSNCGCKTLILRVKKFLAALMRSSENYVGGHMISLISNRGRDLHAGSAAEI